MNTTVDFNAIIERIDILIEQENHAKNVTSIDELRSRYATREELLLLQCRLINKNDSIAERLNRLPRLAALRHVEWATAVLNMPNVAFVVIDTTGIADDADIIRVLIADSKGATLFDRIVSPQRQINQPNTRYTGITQAELASAPTLADVWGDLQRVLTGKFVLAYNLDFVNEHLRENAKHYQLAPILFIGEDLQRKAGEYYRSSYTLKLSDACHRIGHTMPQLATATDRADGQLILLRAMSCGITSTKPQIDDPILGEIDEHPF